MSEWLNHLKTESEEIYKLQEGQALKLLKHEEMMALRDGLGGMMGV